MMRKTTTPGWALSGLSIILGFVGFSYVFSDHAFETVMPLLMLPVLAMVHWVSLQMYLQN